MLDFLLPGCAAATEAVLVLLMMRTRVFRVLPAFFVYVCWSVVSDAVPFMLQFVHSAIPFRLYQVQMIVDSAMMFAVLVELAWSVLRPVRSSLPQKSWIGLAVLVALAGALLWPVAGLTVPSYLTAEGAVFFR